MLSTSAKFYDRFSFLYPIVEVFLRPQKKELFKRINDLPFGQLLEVGVGQGTSLKYYKTHSIHAIDTSRKMLARAHKHARRDIHLFHMNGEMLAFPNETFDYVVLSHVVAVVENPEKLLTEVYRVLKPNGRMFILNHFTPTNGLKYLDMAVEGLLKRLHVKSIFSLADLPNLKKFTLVYECNASLFSYFKILVYAKNH